MPTGLQSLRARARAWPPPRVDAAIGALVFAEVAVESAFPDASAGAHVGALAVAAGAAVAVALRRRAPVVAVALAWAVGSASNALPEALTESSVGLFLALLFIVYSMALHTDGRRLWAGVAISLAGVGVVVATAPDSEGGDLVFLTLIAVVAPVTAGQLLQGRLRLNRALREKTRRLERERTQRSEEAAARERARIAGELHDVVAHALGAMTVQAAAARRLATNDGPRAAGAFEAVEGTGREALTELRRLLAVLRSQDEDAALAPQPGLAAIAELVRRTRAAGLPVDLAVEGDPNGELPPGVDLTAYRVVQEALAEALRCGGEHADVTVRYRPHEIEVAVVDDGVRAARRRLLGMHERVRVYGGQLHAGPGRGGGHEVRARLPVEASP